MKKGVCGMQTKRTHCAALTRLSSAKTPPSTRKHTTNSVVSAPALLLALLLLLLALLTVSRTVAATASKPCTNTLVIVQPRSRSHKTQQRKKKKKKTSRKERETNALDWRVVEDEEESEEEKTEGGNQRTRETASQLAEPRVGLLDLLELLLRGVLLDVCLQHTDVSTHKHNTQQQKGRAGENKRKVSQICSGVLPWIMDATVRQRTSTSGLMSR